MWSMTVGIKYFVLNIIFLILTAHIERSGIFDYIFSKLSGKRYSLNFILTLIFFFSPFFLFPVFLELGSKISKKTSNPRSVFSLIIISTLVGSFISPIGNQRNIFLHTYLTSYYPEYTQFLNLFFKNTIILWLSTLLIINLYVVVFKFNLNSEIERNKFRYKELLFFIISLFLILPFSMGKLNFQGFAFLIIFLMIAFTSLETIKITKWIYLIPTLIIIPLSVIPVAHPLKLQGFFNHLIPFITSGLITSNFSAVIFSYPDIDEIGNLIRGLCSGSLIPVFGAFEIIYVKFIKKGDIDIKIFLFFSLVCFLISLIL